MAEEPQKPAEEVVAVAEVEAEAVKETQPTTAEGEAEKKGEEEEEEAGEVVEGGKGQIAQSVSFKEETNVVGELPEAQKKALDDLKHLIQEALNKHELSAPPPLKDEKEKKLVAAAEQEEKKEEVVAEKKEQEKEKKGDEEPKLKKEEEEEKKEEVVAVEQQVEKKEEEKKETEEEVVAEVMVEKAKVADEEEGAKTVEAIEETKTEEAEAEASSSTTKEKEAEEPPSEEVEIWGIPLLADERSDVILLKFLRARDFKVKDAFNMIKNTVRWRKEFGIEALVEEDLGRDWDKVVFSHGYDKEGHSVCYNVFGEFQDKELYQKTFSDEEKRQKFIRWRIQLLEKSVRKLDFTPTPTGISTIVQVNDLRNSPGLTKRDLRLATNQALQLLQDNYPEFVAKQVFINVPWWYLAFSRMISAFLTQRTKSKFVFAGPSKSADTLFKYIAPEQVPVQYGGLSREGGEQQEFTTSDPVTEVTIKPAAKHTVEFPFSEKSHLVWELRVVGWDVSYVAEFVPSAEDGYTVIVQKSRKIGPADETIISNSFKVGEPGKVLLTIDNQTSKKKKLLYRSKTNPISD